MKQDEKTKEMTPAEKQRARLKARNAIMLTTGVLMAAGLAGIVAYTDWLDFKEKK